MVHIYEIDSGRGLYWEVWQEIPGEAWQDEYLSSLENKIQLNEYIDDLEYQGMDFILHEADDALV